MGAKGKERQQHKKNTKREMMSKTFWAPDGSREVNDTYNHKES